MTRLSAVLRAKPDGGLKVVEGAIRIALESINGSQRVMNIFLVGNHFVGLIEILQSLLKVPAVERRHSARVVAFRRPGTLFMVPLALAISQMNSRPVSHLPDRTRGNLLKKRSSSFEVPSLEIFDSSSEILQRGCALCVHKLPERLGRVLYTGFGPHMHRAMRRLTA
jgi:hypothetical protein